MSHRAPLPPVLGRVLPSAIYEINTWVWLGELSRRAGRALTLAEVPDEAWDAAVPEGIDCVWLMGVWQRSQVSRAVALSNAELRRSWDKALPGWSEDEVIGSPYAIRGYVCDDALGGPEGLAAARSALASRGARLLVDLVPNHVAPDHPLLTTTPDAFVRGSAEDLAEDPAAFYDAGADVIVARARDPYFPPWADVVQLDVFSSAARAFLAQSLADIAKQADGVRCDMAMLLLDDVFKTTWGSRVGDPPDVPLWVDLLGPVRREHPGFVLIAEAYWGREPDLITQGFDACYDKTLYDRLVGGTAQDVWTHLVGMGAANTRTVRFLENHDEPRARDAVLPEGRARAASVLLATVPGATLWHEGQLDGRRVRLPVFLSRRLDEPVSAETSGFLSGLIAAASAVRAPDGRWSVLDTQGWPDNDSHLRLVAHRWMSDEAVALVIVNLSDGPAQALVMGGADLAGRRWVFTDALDGSEYVRDGDDLAQGLYIELPAWGHHAWLALRS
jgi:hypothetical protein